MSLSSVSSLKLNPFSSNTTTKAVKAVETKTESKSLSSDQLLIGTKQKVEIQKGVFPTVKGVLAGGAAAAGVGMLAGGLIGGSQYVKTGIGLGGLLFAVPGMVAGAAVANYTNSKAKGAMAGAIVGGLAGAVAMPLLSGGFGSGFSARMAAVGAAGGALGGAMGGFGGALVAKQK